MTTVAQRPAQLPEVREQTATGDRFVAGAALTVAALLVAVQALAGELIPPLAFFGAVYLGVGIAIGRRRSRWLLVTMIVLALVHLLGSVPFFAASLSHPESPASFLSEAFIAVAVLAALVGAIGGLRGAQPGSRRPIAAGAVGLGIAAVAVSLVATAGATSDASEPGDVPLLASAVTFPERVEVPAGGAVLWIDNTDPVHHTFVIEGTDVHQNLPGSTAVRTPIDLAAGTYRFFCDVPGHERMEGDLVAH